MVRPYSRQTLETSAVLAGGTRWQAAGCPGAGLRRGTRTAWRRAAPRRTARGLQAPPTSTFMATESSGTSTASVPNHTEKSSGVVHMA
ncbi:MAG: hypothetical protein JWQ19_1505 [Subtercola sp.]|nr:hypothetical protein [Subtercola sp.]